MKRELLYGSIAAFIFAVIAIAAILFGLSGCKTTKVAKDIRITETTRIKDSIHHIYVTHKKDSTIIKDTLVRVKYDRAEWSFPSHSTKDTAIRSGRATLRISVNNGQVTGQADCDSFDILVTDLRILYRNEQTENQLLTKQLQDYKASHTELTVKTESKSWFGRLWATVQRYFAWFGLIAFVYLIWKVYKRVATGR